MAKKKTEEEPAEPEPAPEPEHVLAWRERLAAKWLKERTG